MSLKNLSNDTLLGQVKKLVGDEKKIVVQVIEYLKEIELRQLHLVMSYSSMFAFATEYLGYSEAEAHVRLQAARLAQVVPEVKDRLLSGELNLSVAAHAQSQFRKEDQRRKASGEKPLRREEKQEVLELVNNCSRRQAEEKLSTYFAGPSDLKEFKFKAPRELEQKLESLMDEYSHQNFDRDLGNLIEILVDHDLKRIEKRRNGPVRKAQPKSQTTAATSANTQANTQAKSSPQASKKPGSKRTQISITKKREVWSRSGKSCTFTDPISGKRCDATHALEFDHIIPLSKGGSNDLENLTILCDAHNRWKGANRVRD